MLKGIIFDFDGVIAESIQVKTEAFATLYKPYGTDIVNNIIKHHEANGGVSRFEKIRFYHETFLNKVVTNDEIKELADRFSKLVVKKVIDSPYVPGVLDFIKKLNNKYKIYISTGTPTFEIKMIIRGRGISEYFSKVYGSPEKKDDHINKIINEYRFKPEELLFFGDSNSDLEAASSSGLHFILRRHTINKKHFLYYRGKAIR